MIHVSVKMMIAAIGGEGGGRMGSRQFFKTAGMLLSLICAATLPAAGQSFRVQCPPSTITHPGDNNSEPPYNGPTQFTRPTTGIQQWAVPTAGTVNGAIKCQQVSGGDGYMTEADGTQTFMFSFGPLSGLADIASGKTGAEFPSVFNTPYPGTLVRGDPAHTDGASAGNSPWTGFPGAYTPGFTWNGAVGLAPDVVQNVTVTDLVEGAIPAPGTAPGCPTPTANTVTAWTNEPIGLRVGTQVIISSATSEGGNTTPAGYTGTYTISCVATGAVITPSSFTQFAFQYIDPTAGLAADTGNDLAAIASTPPVIDGHVDPRPIMDIGVMNGNIPGPLLAFDEDDEVFLTLTNVGLTRRTNWRGKKPLRHFYLDY